MSLSGGVSVQDSLRPGRSLSRAVSVQGRSLSRGGLSPGEVSVQGALCPGGSLSGGSVSRWVSVQGGLCQGDCPPVNRMTDACENITLAQTSFAGGNESVGDLGFPRRWGGEGGTKPKRGLRMSTYCLHLTMGVLGFTTGPIPTQHLDCNVLICC